VSTADRFEEQLVDRLRELRPLAVEYQQLEQVAHRLGLVPGDELEPDDDGVRVPRREREVLELVRARPGLTVRQIAERLDVDSTNLYRHVRKLEEEGAITKRGTALHPVRNGARASRASHSVAPPGAPGT